MQANGPGVPVFATAKCNDSGDLWDSKVSQKGACANCGTILRNALRLTGRKAPTRQILNSQMLICE